MDVANSNGRADIAEGKILGMQFERQADNASAESIQIAKAERKKARLVASRARAVAGASGAGVSDPTVTDILSDIDAEGELNALNELFSGANRAKDLRYQGEVARREGASKAMAGFSQATARGFSAATDFMSNNPSFFSKYGGRSSPTMNAPSVATGTGYSDFANMPDSGSRYA